MALFMETLRRECDMDLEIVQDPAKLPLSCYLEMQMKLRDTKEERERHSNTRWKSSRWDSKADEAEAVPRSAPPTRVSSPPPFIVAAATYMNDFRWDSKADESEAAVLRLATPTRVSPPPPFKMATATTMLQQQQKLHSQQDSRPRPPARQASLLGLEGSEQQCWWASTA
jgi:hypothetical protein